MNKIDTHDSTDKTSTLEVFWAFLDYMLNKCMPVLLVGYICVNSFGYKTWEPYVILGFIFFSNNFNFNCGYAKCVVDNEESKENFKNDRCN